MGTRGAYGFRVDGKDKVTYNHYDSYPYGLGIDILQYISNTPLEKINQVAKKIIMVDSDNKATVKEQKRYMNNADFSVSSKDPKEWYVLLRNTQGNLSVYNEDEGNVEHMIDSQSFLLDSLFCEYAYIINVDSGMFEYYEGFNKKAEGAGRYASIEPNKDHRNCDSKYYGVTLCKEINLTDLYGLTDKEVETLAGILETNREDA